MSGADRVCIHPGCEQPYGPIHSHPREPAPVVQDLSMLVTVDGVNVRCHLQSDGTWVIDVMNLRLPYGHDLRDAALPHRDKQAAIDAATMFAVELAKLHAHADEGRMRLRTVMHAYALRRQTGAVL